MKYEKLFLVWCALDVYVSQIFDINYFINFVTLDFIKSENVKCMYIVPKINVSYRQTRSNKLRNESKKCIL